MRFHAIFCVDSRSLKPCSLRLSAVSKDSSVSLSAAPPSTKENIADNRDLDFVACEKYVICQKEIDRCLGSYGRVLALSRGDWQ